MIFKAIELGVKKVYIITSSSLDGKNPLPCSSETIPKPKNKSDSTILSQMNDVLIYKSSVLNSMIQSYKEKLISEEPNDMTKQKIAGVNVIVICSVGSPFRFINNLIKNDFIDKGIQKINMFFIVGRDRADFLDTVVENFSQNDYIKTINGLVLPREGMEALKTSGLGKRTISEISETEYSASFIRNLVKNNQREDFENVYRDYLSPSDINLLYQTIQKGIQMKSPPSKGENENPHSRYFDEGLLPVMGPSSGGKKRTKRNNKKKRTKRTKRNNQKNHKKRTKGTKRTKRTK